MKVRLLYKSDGSVAIIHPVLKSKKINETQTEWLERIFIKANPDNLPFKDIEHTNLPSRRFRNQWVPSVNGVIPDLVKSRKQVLIELQTVRNLELIVTDGKMAKENEIGNAASQNDIKNYRQNLRDIPALTTIKLNSISDVNILELKYPRILTIDEYLIRGQNV